MKKKIISVLCVLLMLAVCSACSQDPLDKVSAVEMSPSGGTFTDSVEVSLTCATSGAKIYYTTDGSEPDESSTAYSDPFKVTSSLTVKARAYLDGMDLSDVSSAAYSIVYGRWQIVGSSDFSEEELEDISLALYQDTPYIAYTQTDGPGFLKKYNGTGWEEFGDNPVSAHKIIFDADGTLFSVASNGIAYVKKKRVNASEWETLGDMESDFPGYTSKEYEGRIGFAVHNGVPYLACQNWEEDEGTGCVIRFNGTNWENVGQPDFSGDMGAYQMDIAFDNNGVPSVCFFESAEYDGLGFADFMTLNDSNDTWELVSDDFSDCNIGYPDLAFDASGTPYVVFEDVDNSHKAVVMKYNGSEWSVVGNAGFSRGKALGASLAFKGDVPYVCFSSYLDGVIHDDDNYRINVMMFDGQEWLYVGKEIIFDEVCLRPSIAIDSTGAVYIAFIWGGTKQICVMKYAP